MYENIETGILKNSNFILGDIFSLSISLLFSYYIVNTENVIDIKLYILLILLSWILVILNAFFTENYKEIRNRGYINELKKSSKLVISVFSLIIFTLFVFKVSSIYSRKVILLWMFFSMFFCYIQRLIIKKYLTKYKRLKGFKKIVVIAQDEAKETETFITKMKQYYEVVKIYEDDIKNLGKNNLEEIKQFCLENPVDEVVFVIDNKNNYRYFGLINEILSMGLTAHIILSKNENIKSKCTLTKMEEYNAVTFYCSTISDKSLFLKRIFDIFGAVIGLIFTLIISIFVVPAIYLSSPGPAIFRQKRVGKNGRIFDFYKFRSMYIDAEKKKKELEEQNQMKGNMFKIENDPRITKVGKFIRKTSIDEFPQFWNVLKGDMSLVGTRPPTLDEYYKYESHHKARLAMKPGLTGMWQANGRNKITDFEEIVKLDTEYINNWGIGLDFKLILKTIKKVFMREGSM